MSTKKVVRDESFYVQVINCCHVHHIFAAFSRFKTNPATRSTISIYRFTQERRRPSKKTKLRTEAERFNNNNINSISLKLQKLFFIFSEFYLFLDAIYGPLYNKFSSFSAYPQYFPSAVNYPNDSEFVEVYKR